MLNHELLISKGFELNEYPEGKFYELVIDNPKTELLNILEYGYDEEANQIIFQMWENFTNIIVMIDGEVWDLSTEELIKVLNNLW